MHTVASRGLECHTRGWIRVCTRTRGPNGPNGPGLVTEKKKCGPKNCLNFRETCHDLPLKAAGPLGVVRFGRLLGDTVARGLDTVARGLDWGLDGIAHAPRGLSNGLANRKKKCGPKNCPNFRETCH